MNPNEADLYGGIAGAEPSIQGFEFGYGVTLSKTYAHVFAPFLIAFDRPETPQGGHPGPWKAVSGGIGFDIEAEIHVPPEFSMSGWFDRVNTVWWLTALMRLKATPLITAPVLASQSFAVAAEEPTEFWPVEIRSHRLRLNPEAKATLDRDDLDWIRDHWIEAGRMMTRSADFSVAFRAFDACVWTTNAPLAMVSLWGALERMFSPSHSELRFRVPATIASYVEAPGKERFALFKRAKGLYDVRSKAAHGGKPEEESALAETYVLAKKVLMMMIEAGHVPTRAELEAKVFGAPSNG